MAKKTATPPVEKPRAEDIREKEFNEAVERLYRRYGSDLSAFLRDVEIELTKRETSSAL